MLPSTFLLYYLVCHRSSALSVSYHLFQELGFCFFFGTLDFFFFYCNGPGSRSRCRRQSRLTAFIINQKENLQVFQAGEGQSQESARHRQTNPKCKNPVYKKKKKKQGSENSENQEQEPLRTLEQTATRRYIHF